MQDTTFSNFAAVGEVYVATCDVEIADAVTSYGGQVIMTGRHHQNGTTRVAEAAAEIDGAEAAACAGAAFSL